MEKIFLSYPSIDNYVAQRLSDFFKSKDLEVFVNDPVFVNSTDYKKGLEKMVIEADIYIIIYSGYNDQRDIDFIEYQVNFIKGYIQNIKKDKLFIPFIHERIKNSDLVRELFSEYQKIYFSDYENMLGDYETLYKIINAYIGKSIATEQNESAIIQKIERSAEEFIQEAITGLENREKKLSQIANRWYITGYISIGLAILTAIFFLFFFNKVSNPLELILRSVKSLIIILLFVAAAKYCFDLAKTFMNESLKNADRIHAISFGKFYMKVFGDKVNSDEIMKVFQYWNISNNSSFSKLSTKDFDPNILEQLNKLVEALKNSEIKESK